MYYCVGFKVPRGRKGFDEDHCVKSAINPLPKKCHKSFEN